MDTLGSAFMAPPLLRAAPDPQWQQQAGHCWSGGRWGEDGSVLVLMLGYNYSFIPAYKVAEIYYFSRLQNKVPKFTDHQLHGQRVSASSVRPLPRPLSALVSGGCLWYLKLFFSLRVCENDLNNKNARRKFFCIST